MVLIIDEASRLSEVAGEEHRSALAETSCEQQSRDAKAVDSVVKVDFEADLERQLTGRLMTLLLNDEHNTVISPYGLYTSLRILYEGAHGASRDCLSKALGVDKRDYLHLGEPTILWREIGRPIVYSPNVVLHVNERGFELMDEPTEGSPLYLAGFRRGDIITEYLHNREFQPVGPMKTFLDFCTQAMGHITVKGIDNTSAPFERRLHLTARRRAAPATEWSFVCANIICFTADLKVDENFRHHLGSFGPSELFPVGSDQGLTTREIAFFLQKETGGRIVFEPIFSMQPHIDIAACTAFDANWFRSMQKETTPSEFENPSGTRKLTYLTRQAQFRYTETDNVQVLELPFSDGITRCLVWLPKTVAQRDAAASEMTNADSRQRVLKSLAPKGVLVRIPQFEVTTHVEREKLLSLLSIEELFHDSADFSGIIPDSKLDKFTHHAALEFREDGVHAKSETLVTVIPKTAVDLEVNFEATRPFFFELIEDRDVCLFLGAFNGPE